MKICCNNKKELVEYKDINIGECFEYERTLYLKCWDNIPGGKVYDIDLWRGIVSDSLENDILVKPLPDAKIYMYKNE